MDVIVTDHHRVQGGRPDAFAVIHPQVSSEFPNPHLSGSGVAFMLVRALENLKSWDDIDIDIALATIGTVGDLVPLTGENRILVMHGLRFIADLPPSPLREFVESVRAAGPLTATDLAFRIVPRINAAGRMAHPLVALEAILEGGKALEELHRLNGDRRSLVEELHEHLSTSIPEKDAFLVVWSDQITPGTAGLIASRLSEQFGRPSLVAAVLGDMAVASVRSIPEIDVMDILSDSSAKKLLKTFGGHAQAAGCTFELKNADKLRSALNKVLEDRGLSVDTMLPTLEIDAEIHDRHVTLLTGRSLASLAPFGSCNKEPLFLLSKQKLTSLRVVGSDGSHLQATINGVRSVGFRLGQFIDALNEDTSVDLACRIGVNTWNGRDSVQLVIEDIRESMV
jgi:single-stranded-DNA-specific exonuclease